MGIKMMIMTIRDDDYMIMMIVIMMPTTILTMMNGISTPSLTHSSGGIIDSLRAEVADGGRSKKQQGQPVRATLGSQFRSQLVGLLRNLRLTEPHFIRCIKVGR